ncbi:MAG: dUTP diphosphatase [Oscillospiraceae bacterium]|nr:dUTP diphosphatase [Oscillospiraceae bacterium]
MKIMLDKGAKMPTRAHPFDGGLDLYAPECGCVYTISPCGGSAVIDTGVHVEIPEGYVGFIKAKSGLNVKHGLTCTGVIDSHYTGSIAVKLYNHHHCLRYDVRPGDKIAQLVILPCLLPELELVDSLEETDRGDNGFGSTGR